MIESEADGAAAIADWLANPVLNPVTLVLIGLVLSWDWPCSGWCRARPRCSR